MGRAAAPPTRRTRQSRKLSPEPDAAASDPAPPVPGAADAAAPPPRSQAASTAERPANARSNARRTSRADAAVADAAAQPQAPVQQAVPAKGAAAGRDAPVEQGGPWDVSDRRWDKVRERGGEPEDGWTLEVKFREYCGTSYIYFHPPAARAPELERLGLKCCRSMVDVARVLGRRVDADDDKRAELHRRARALAAEEGLAVPLRAADDVTVTSLGEVRTQAAFHTHNCVFPVGYTAEWVGAATGCVFTSSIVASEDAADPIFQVSLQSSRDPLAPRTVLASSPVNADEAWREVDLLARVAASKDGDRVCAGGELSQVDDLQVALLRSRLDADPLLAPAMRGAEWPPLLWGALLFGLTDVRTLKLLEALDGVPACEGYRFAEACGGWQWKQENFARRRELCEAAAREGLLLPPAVEPLAKTTGKRKPKSDDPDQTQSESAVRAQALAVAAFGQRHGTDAFTEEELLIQDEIATKMDQMLCSVERHVEAEAIREARMVAQAEFQRLFGSSDSDVDRLAVNQLNNVGLGRGCEALTEDSELPDAEASPPPGAVLASSLPPHIQSSLLQVWMFSRQFAPLLGLEQLDYAAVEESLGAQAPSGAAPAGEQLTIALLRLIVAEAFEASVQEYVGKAGDVAAQINDMAAGCPVIDHDTWQHAAAAVVAGVAMGQYFKQLGSSGSAYKPATYWDGLQGDLDPTLWLTFLTGAYVNTPALRPEHAFLPSDAPATTSMAILQRQACEAALAAHLLCADADEAGHGLGAARAAVCAADGPGSGGAAVALLSSQAGADQQARVEKFMNELLVSLSRQQKDLVSRISHAGEEIAIAAGSGRPVDLHSIALGVKGHVYACAGDAVAAAAEDVRELCAGMRAAAQRLVIPLRSSLGTQGAAMADAVEKALEEVLSAASTAEAIDNSGGDAKDAGAAARSRRSPLETLLTLEPTHIEPQHLRETVEQQRSAPGGASPSHPSHPTPLQELIQLEKLAALLTHPPTPDCKLTAEQHVALLHCLLLLALDAGQVRGALKDARFRWDELSSEAAGVAKELKQLEKQFRQEAAGAIAAVALATPGAVGIAPLAEKVEELQHRRVQIKREMAELALESTPHLGQDRHHNDYWCLPSSALEDEEARRVDWVVVCQQYDPHAAPTSRDELDAAPPADAAEGMVFHSGWRGDRASWHPRRDVTTGRWLLYATPAELDALEGWLLADGAREGPLKARLRFVRSVLTLQERSEPPAPCPNGLAVAEALRPAPESATAQLDESTVGGGARALALELLRTLQALPEEALLSVRGGEARRRALRRFLVRGAGLPESAAEADCDLDEASPAAAGDCALAPRDLMAALLLIEGMVALPFFKPFWRLWSLPPPLPTRTHTHSAVWFRLKAFQQAVRDDRTATARDEVAAFSRGTGAAGASNHSSPASTPATNGRSGAAAARSRVRAREPELEDTRRTRRRQAVNYAESDDGSGSEAVSDAVSDAVSEDSSLQESAGSPRAVRVHDRAHRRGRERLHSLRPRGQRRVVVDSDDEEDDSSSDEPDSPPARKRERTLNGPVTRNRGK